MEQVQQPDDFLKNKPKLLNLKNFEIGEILGTGCFGRVRVAKNLITKKYCAVKVLKKTELVNLQQVDHIINEMRILHNVDHVFITKMEGYMQDSRLLYIVEELVNGGELFSYLGAMGKLSVDTARFYAAHIVCVFEYLHSKNIIYRDLKPENVLLDRGGYVKLTDFGFAKFCDTRTYTLCGTPEYLAPEILMNKGHGKPVDWWTLGVFIYELLVGIDPFADEDPVNVYQKILAGKVRFPSGFDLVSKKLIKKLLQTDLSKRYGNLVGGVNDIKNHKFFFGMDFEKLLNMELKPPYVPKIISDGDISNFPVYPDSNKEVSPLSETDDPFLQW